MQDCNVKILGTEYKIRFGNAEQFPCLNDMDGYTDSSTKRIVIDDMESVKNKADCKGNLEEYKKQILRHELLHAFLTESGLDASSFSHEHWAFNEEMIDWFAIQSPKIFEVYKELRLI